MVVVGERVRHSIVLIRKPFLCLGVLFFFLMLVIPTTYQIARGAVLGVLLMGCIMSTILYEWRLHQVILFWGLLNVSASLLFIMIGAINNTPGALRVGTVYVLWPMMFLFFMGVFNRPEQFIPFMKVIIVGSIVVALMAIILVADSLYELNLGMLMLLEGQGAGVGLYDGFVEYSLFNMTTAIYAMPFLVGLVLMPSSLSALKNYWRIFIWIALVLSVVTLFLSGRRAFWVIAVLSPFVVWGLLWLACLQTNFLNRFLKVGILGAVIVVVILLFMNFDLISIWGDFLKGFDFSNSDVISASRRSEQFFALIDGWKDYPILGAGHGAAAADNIQLQEQAWAYELTYVALLFQTGLVGFIIYSSAVLWIFVKGIMIMRSVPESAGLLIPLLSGLACFLVANASNPYLQKFDYLWTIFLPVAVLNTYMLRRPQ